MTGSIDRSLGTHRAAVDRARRGALAWLPAASRRGGTMSRHRRASSVFVISDLHLGGQTPAMMGRPGLARLVHRRAPRPPRRRARLRPGAGDRGRLRRLPGDDAVGELHARPARRPRQARRGDEGRLALRPGVRRPGPPRRRRPPADGAARQPRRGARPAPGAGRAPRTPRGGAARGALPHRWPRPPHRGRARRARQPLRRGQRQRLDGAPRHRLQARSCATSCPGGSTLRCRPGARSCTGSSTR